MFRYRYCCYFCRFRKYYNLWAFDKETICDKFVDRGVPLVQLDEKFAFYANIIEELQQLPTAFNIQCIRLNLKPLLDSICQHAQEWCTTLGEKLAAKNVKNIDKMRLEIKLEEFFKDYEANGPGSAGNDLDRGFKLMDPYGQKLMALELKRQELGKSFK
uniref:Uncharacterized protein n=1 Tax=Glossina palpalis gambiensis TaxID=67801 RepID=A0A1B0C4S3_9MUSC